MKSAVFLNRVVLSNYKSIKACSVELGPLTFLVGVNGAGKSNFLDALRFVADSLQHSLEHALRDRGGINEVRRRSSGHPTHFGISLQWQLPDGRNGFYAFKIGAQQNGGFEVQEEQCRVHRNDTLRTSSYKVQSGEVTEFTVGQPPPATKDRLFLISAAGFPDFRPVYDAFSHMGFYNLNPDVIRELQPPDPGELLKRDGSNLASVLNVLEKENPGLHSRVIKFLSNAVPGITGVEMKPLGKKETLEFKQRIGKNRHPWRFMAENMSDGTLRALGVLTALFQSSDGNKVRVPFVGIEEPEAAVHPGAAGILRDGLLAASRNIQVAVTSHSPELLDDKGIAVENILAVENHDGETKIGPIDEAGRTAIRKKLFTVGELMRMNQLEADKITKNGPSADQFELFPE